jgi:hypothetical protein
LSMVVIVFFLDSEVGSDGVFVGSFNELTVGEGDARWQLCPQGLSQHPPYSLPHDLINQRWRTCLRTVVAKAESGTSVSIGARLPDRRANVSLA